jgi:hypothetical protein
MAITYENVTPTLIENTTMQKSILNGVHKTYLITPISGYVLHDKNYDEEIIDPETYEPIGEIKLGYRRTTASCAANYDFLTNPREFYTVLESEVPADQVYGGGNNDHEIA